MPGAVAFATRDDFEGLHLADAPPQGCQVLAYRAGLSLGARRISFLSIEFLLKTDGELAVLLVRPEGCGEVLEDALQGTRPVA